MSEQKKFRSISGKDVQVALLSGHVAMVGVEWRPLPALFHQEAYARGCISDDMLSGIKGPDSMSGGSGNTALSDEERKQKIESVIKSLVDANNPESFTSTGLPRADVVNKECGFTTTAEERNAAFDAIME